MAMTRRKTRASDSLKYLTNETLYSAIAWNLWLLSMLMRASSVGAVGVSRGSPIESSAAVPAPKKSIDNANAIRPTFSRCGRWMVRLMPKCTAS